MTTRGMFCPRCGGFTVRTDPDLDICRVDGCSDTPLEEYDPALHPTLTQRLAVKS